MPRKKVVEEKPRRFMKAEASKEIPLHMRDDLVFEKICPSCGKRNYTSEIANRNEGYARIWFTCKKCGKRYSNWWYGTSPSDGNEPLWYEILRKPFKAICIKKSKGITVEKIYDAFDSTENDDNITILKNDSGAENTEYAKDLFIVDTKKHR